MVRKVKVIEEPEDGVTEYQKRVIALLEAIDWKLWEIYKHQSRDVETLDDLEVSTDFKPVRVKKEK